MKKYIILIILVTLLGSCGGSKDTIPVSPVTPKPVIDQATGTVTLISTGSRSDSGSIHPDTIMQRITEPGGQSVTIVSNGPPIRSMTPEEESDFRDRAEQYRKELREKANAGK